MEGWGPILNKIPHTRLIHNTTISNGWGLNLYDWYGGEEGGGGGGGRRNYSLGGGGGDEGYGKMGKRPNRILKGEFPV